MTRSALTVNGRTYQWPQRPLVVVCVDGCEPDYITQAVQAGAAPWFKRVLEHGSSFTQSQLTDIALSGRWRDTVNRRKYL